MRLSKLLRMGASELACRTRQEASKRLDRLIPKRHALRRPEAILRIDITDVGEGGRSLLELFRDSLPRRFFEGATSEGLPSLFAGRLPAARDAVLASAEAICDGSFDLLGYRGLRFGDPLDWHLDPISGRRSPLAHWSRLDPLDPAAAGDSKIVWELNRHQWLVRLGQAYRLTGDEHYARVFADSVRHWLTANPPGVGINWTSSLEAALRLISWCWALALFGTSEALSLDLFLSMLTAIWTHASHVESYLSHYFSPNTHLTGEALGLFYAGTLFPEFRAARRWRSLGAQILADQSEKQVLRDGVYFEQSTCYQRYTVEIYLHFLLLARRNSAAVPPAIEERVERMLDFLLAMRRPDGSMPQVGDADGGWLLPLTSRSPEDFRGVFSVAAAYFRRADCAWAGGSLAPEAAWLLGPALGERAHSIQPAPPPLRPSRLFEAGGYAVMRSDWTAQAHHLIFDVGPLGAPPTAGHGHADLLSIQCSAFGKPYLVDAGTYCYTPDGRWRDYFRSTHAHSGVIVDGESQAAGAGPFAWQERPAARLHRWMSTDTFDLADASHDAYRRLPDPVIHRRRVLFVKPRYWAVVDDLTGDVEHRVEIRFQFARLELTVDAEGWARAGEPGDAGLLVRSFAAMPLKVEIHEGEVSPIQGWISPDYGVREAAPALAYVTVARPPIRVVTLLVPVEHPHSVLPAVTPLLSKTGELAGLTLEATGETIRIDEHDVVLEHR